MTEQHREDTAAPASSSRESELPQAVASAESPVVKRRSRKVYVLWGVALAVLLTGGIASWAFVIPYYQARSALDRNTRYDAETAKMEVARLGGPSAAARKLRVYLLFPDSGMLAMNRRSVVIQMLAHCGEHGVDSLVGLLDVVDGEPPTGSYAAHVLGDIGPPAREAIPALRKRLHSRNIHLSCAAARAIWRITGESEAVIPVMIDTMRDGPSIGYAVPQRAADILVEIGPAAIPALEKLLANKDTHEFASVPASEALEKIKAAQEERK